MQKLPLVDENNNVITAPSKWSDITLSKWQEFCELLVALNKGATMLEEGESLTQMSYEHLLSKYPSYIIKVVGFWTGLTDSELLHLDYDQITYVYGLIFNSLTPPEADESIFESFKFKGVEYKAKKTERDIDGNLIFLKGTSFIEGIEFMQLSMLGKKVGSGEFHNINKQIAIVYRPYGEEYDEDKAQVRAELFKDLTMDIVWQVAFFFASLKNSYTRVMLSSLTQKVKEAHQTLKDGDFTTSSTQPQKGVLLIWRRLKDRIFTRS